MQSHASPVHGVHGCPTQCCVSTLKQEENFHLVDNRPVKTNKFGPRRFQPNRFQQNRQGGRGDGRDGRDGKGGMDNRQQDRQKGKQNQFNQRPPWMQYGRDAQRTQYSSSVDVRPEWAVIEQIPFQSLQKLNCAVGEPEDVVRWVCVWDVHTEGLRTQWGLQGFLVGSSCLCARRLGVCCISGGWLGSCPANQWGCGGLVW